ncbi:MAG: disulfide bond formation protein DsbA [Nostocales cyanobacterium]|nr:MAG: disulfide bond formation protein DsbA [Nostocales cyanobacterium]TAF07138.1 MAG: disulfide bond formation protein DsbA [Nostocales cyanobacterium]
MLTMFKKILNLVIISLLFLTLTWSLPAQATIKIDPQLEQQVLEIIRKNPQVLIESVQAYQEQQKTEVQQARQEFIQDLRSKTQSIIAASPTIGSTELKTVLIEFSDFECPYCSEAQKTLKQLLAKYPDQLTLVYKNFPLYQIHDQALPSARSAYAAQQQGKFWEYHDALFANQKRLGEKLYLEIAKKLNLDLAKFKNDRNLADSAIQKDLQLAEKLGLSGTPSFIIKSQNVAGPVQLSEIEDILAVEK